MAPEGEKKTFWVQGGLGPQVLPPHRPSSTSPGSSVGETPHSDPMSWVLVTITLGVPGGLSPRPHGARGWRPVARCLPELQELSVGLAGAGSGGWHAVETRLE